MDRLEEKRLQLIASVRRAVELILTNGEVTYVVCVRLRDPETQKTCLGLMSNLSYRNNGGEGEITPATPGMIMDILLEAMFDNPNFLGPDKAPDIPPTNSRVN